MLKDPLPQVQNVAVLGLGRSGIAAARLLRSFGKQVIASDAQCLDEAALRERLPDVELRLGANDFGNATVAILSPGITPDAPILAQARERGISTLAELELGARCTQLPTVAITGTDGKTTTTMLAAHVLQHSGIGAIEAGNIGIPLCEVLLGEPSGTLVVEVSAFQLLHCPTFAPSILIATNIAQDHMDYFKGDWDSYVAAKRRPLDNMNEGQWAVLNASHPIISSWAHNARPQLAWYGFAEDVPTQRPRAYATKTELVFELEYISFSLPLSDLRLRGHHNILNALAATLGACIAGARPEAAVETLRTFNAPPHRIEYIRELDGVAYINDSKATNPHAATAGLLTVEAPVVLIAGGVDKALSLDTWIEAMRTRVSALLLIGELAPRLEQSCREAQLKLPIEHCPTLPDAVRRARVLASNTSKTVLFSPGCSSYDMFPNYVARGNSFRQAVEAL
ncbi:MAG: UDP-N-acetylmuramoyl-L-alanine--D-glutamate ligase [Myxococcota bacterium]|jgi:UDP-N-acetylmuramoylalanine--D-glutamate ligase|nr:UDP-N-acetylmuramoyl-L-alanine--D-glutamate ligase [Myxococcota bacterium]